MKITKLTNQDITGKTVLIDIATAFKPGYGAQYEGMPFKATFGNGCHAQGKVYGMFRNGDEFAMRREWVAGIIADDPTLDRMVEIATQARKDYSDAQPRGDDGSYVINFVEQDAVVKERLTEFLQTQATLALVEGS